jgi:hypothetical protein
VGRAELLCAIFVLLGFYFGSVGSRLEHVSTTTEATVHNDAAGKENQNNNNNDNNSNNNDNNIPTDLRFYLVLTSNVLMTLCTILAVLSKEVGLCVLPFIGFYDLLTFALPTVCFACLLLVLASLCCVLVWFGLVWFFFFCLIYIYLS